ncbi:MAG: permease-like cell division protein FtsX [Clostridia bacterium]|nr:permease-like cell division protein FtsX [Clostridia bacterium]
MGSRPGYILREGLKSVFSNKIMSAASVCIIAATLTLTGLFMAMGINVNAFMNRLGNSAEINVYLKSDAGGRTINDIESDLKKIDGVRSVRFFSREDRMNKVSKEVYGEDGYVFSSGENPLRDSYILTVSDLARCSAIGCEAAEVEGVDEVIRNDDIIGGIDMLTSSVKSVGLWIMLILLLLSVFVVYMTVRQATAAHGDEIRIMSIVGATRGFIRGPYVVQGMLLGLFGAVIACAAIILGYGLLTTELAAVLPRNIVSFVPVGRTAALIVPLLAVSGTVIGSFGGFIAAERYLK